VDTGVSGGYSIIKTNPWAKAEYTLDYSKGTEPGRDTVKIWTYGRGRKKYETKAEMEIIEDRWGGTIDPDNGTYRVKGRIRVDDVPETGKIIQELAYEGGRKRRMEIPIDKKRDIREKCVFQGNFTREVPDTLQGTFDGREKPPPGVDFETVGGIYTWKLKKKTEKNKTNSPYRVTNQPACIRRKLKRSHQDSIPLGDPFII